MFEKQFEKISGYVDLGLWEDANNLIEDLPPEAKTLPQVLVLQTHIYRELGAWKLMLGLSRHLTIIEPEKALHWLYYAQAKRYYCEGISPALEVLEKAGQQFPEDAGVLYALAHHEAEIGEINRAKDHLTSALRLDPNFRKDALHDHELNPLCDNFSERLEDDGSD